MILERFLINNAIQFCFVSLDVVATGFRKSATSVQFDDDYDAGLMLTRGHNVLDKTGVESSDTFHLISEGVGGGRGGGVMSCV